MGAKENAAAVRGSLEAFNRREPGAPYVHQDAKVELVPFGTKLDYDRYNEMWSRAFPDARIELKSIVADDRFVAVEFVGKGTHEGPFDMPGRRVEPTHRAGELRLVQLFELRDGKIAGARVYFDVVTLMANMGIGPELMADRGREKPAPEARH